MRPPPARERRSERARRIGNWLISTLAWGPLLLWVTWPLADDRFAWHPAVGYGGMAAVGLSWVYVGWAGVNRRRWPAVVALLVALCAPFSVAAGSDERATYAALSIVAGGLVSGVVSGSIVVLAVLVARVRDCGALEDAILLVAPLVVAEMVIGITAGAIIGDSGSPFLGVVAGLAAGLFVSIFCLSWVYGAIGIASSWAARRSEEGHQVGWWGEIEETAQ